MLKPNKEAIKSAIQSAMGYKNNSVCTKNGSAIICFLLVLIPLYLLFTIEA